MSKQKLLTAIEMVKDGASFREASRATGLPDQTIRRKCNALGVASTHAHKQSTAHLDEIGLSDYENAVKKGFRRFEALRIAEDDMNRRNA